MSQSVALCSEGGKFFNTTERRGVSEGEKEKNISEPVFKNEAKPNSEIVLLDGQKEITFGLKEIGETHGYKCYQSEYYIENGIKVIQQ